MENNNKAAGPAKPAASSAAVPAGTARKGEVVITDQNGNATTLNAQIIKDMLCPNATRLEIAECLALCRLHNLNPFTREVYMVKYGTSPAQIIVSKEAFLKRANRNADYEGFAAGVTVSNGEGVTKDVDGSLVPPKTTLVGGWATVYRRGRKPLTERVGIDEYNLRQSLWKTKPATMIRKVALVHALREAFPDDLGGMYVGEEMGVGNPSRHARTVDVLEQHAMESHDHAVMEDAMAEKEDAEARAAEADQEAWDHQAEEAYADAESEEGGEGDE